MPKLPTAPFALVAGRIEHYSVLSWLSTPPRLAIVSYKRVQACVIDIYTDMICVCSSLVILPENISSAPY